MAAAPRTMVGDRLGTARPGPDGGAGRRRDGRRRPDRTGRSAAHERTEILLETIRADSQELDAIRGEALSAVELNSRRRIHVGGSLVSRGWKTVYQLYASLGQLFLRFDHPLATALRSDARTILALGTQIFKATEQGSRSPLRSSARRSASRRRSTGSTATRSARLRRRAASRPQRRATLARPSSGRSCSDCWRSCLIATRVHRLRRRLAVEAAQEAMEFHNEARLRALLEHAGDIVTVVGTDLNVRWQAVRNVVIFCKKAAQCNAVRPF